ncbi:MAG: fibronectin type III domain-containing protein [Candidatus Daviesbacteria bacterium]|nr:fibronectin type III domain-containing protein [Candidatus Daviesbacteria bacterium]
MINIKTVVAVLVVAILVAAIPVTTRLTQQQQDIRSKAAGPTIATSPTTLTNTGSGYPVMSIFVTADPGVSWKVYYCTVAGTSCPNAWFAIPNGSGSGNAQSLTYQFPSNETGTHILALFDGNSVTQLASTTITFQTSGGGGEVALTGSIAISQNPVVKSGGSYPNVKVSINNANTNWVVYYNNNNGANCGGTCSATGSWTPFKDISGVSGNTSGSAGSYSFNWTPPSYITGTHTIALFDKNVSGIASKVDVTFQDGGGGSSGGVCIGQIGLNTTTTACGFTASWNLEAKYGANTCNVFIRDKDGDHRISLNNECSGERFLWTDDTGSIKGINIVNGQSYELFVSNGDPNGGCYNQSKGKITLNCPGTGGTGGSRPIEDVPSTCKTSQTCTASGKDTTCPAGSQWCYDGFCINEYYDPETKTCKAPVSDTTCISPGPVTNLRPVDGTEYPAGKRTVTLQWDAPSGGGPLSHYNVRLDDPTTTGTGKEPDVVADNYSSTSLQIPDLDNPTLYSWWVDAVSSCGALPSRAGASFTILGGSANVNYIIEGDVLNETSNPVGGATVCLDPPAGDTTCSSAGLLKSTTSSTDQSELMAGKYHIENVPPAESGHNVFIFPPQGYIVTSENPVLVNQGGISQSKYVGFNLQSPAGTTCEQVVTRARNTATNECKDFPTTCLDAGWEADPSCTATTGQGTTCYLITDELLEKERWDEEGFADCDDSKAIPYDEHPEEFSFAFTDQTAGLKTIYTKFIATDGSSQNFQKAILFKPGSALTNITCSYAPEGTATNITVTGTNLGSHTQLGSGGITVGGKKTQVTWTEGQTEISIQVPERLQSEIPILFQSDGGTVIRGSCVVNLATMNFTANIQCRPPGNLGAQDVQVQIYENLATSSATPRPIISQEIVLDKDGLPTRFTPQLETGKSYTMIIKAPGTVARKVNFIASNGTVIVPGPILLPVGNIAPVALADDQVNAFDKSELIRQWTLISDVVRSGDFNLDKRVNSIDYACMRPNLDTSSPTHQDEVYTLQSLSSTPVNSNSSSSFTVPASFGTADIFRDVILSAYGFTDNASKFIKDNSKISVTDLSGSCAGGGGWQPQSQTVTLNCAQHEAAVHELAHVWWHTFRLQNPEMAKGLARDLVRLANGDGSATAVAFAKTYVQGDGGSFEGMYCTDNGCADVQNIKDSDFDLTEAASNAKIIDWEIFAGLSSWTMGQFKSGTRALPSYLWKYFEPMFTGVIQVTPYYSGGYR